MGYLLLFQKLELALIVAMASILKYLKKKHYEKDFRMKNVNFE